MWQHNGLLQAAQDNLPQILQDSLQHCLLTDVSKDTETESNPNAKRFEPKTAAAFTEQSQSFVYLYRNGPSESQREYK